MYVCMHVRTYACMHACMHACMYVGRYVCMYVCMYVVRTYVCICTYVRPGNDVIDILTSEDMENTPLESKM